MELPWARLREQVERGAEIHGSTVAAPNGQTSHVPCRAPTHGCCVPRSMFDARLVARALDVGCRMERQSVRTLDALRADHDLVIDARGVYAGQPNTVAIRAYWTVPTSHVDTRTLSTVQLFTVERFRMGYEWIFPVHVTPTHVELNLGVGIWREEYDARGVKIRDDFERFVQQNPVARQLARVATERSRTRGHHLALAAERQVVATEGVLRVGDAANLTDPITGEGIANAMLSGRLAAQAIDEAHDAADAQRRWQHAYQTRMLPELMAAVRLRTLLVGTRRKNIAIWALRRSTRLAERFHGSLEGVVSYRDVLPLPRMPSWR